MADDPDLDSAYALETPEDNLRLYKDWAASYDNDFVRKVEYRLPGLVVRRFLAEGGTGPVLDVGCGTGAVGEVLPAALPLDGLDLSPEMLAVAEGKSRYGKLIEANLNDPLPFPDAAYNGLLSAGTFTHGHVGAEALPELIRILAPGALAVVSIRDAVWETMGFAPVFQRLADEGAITPPRIDPEQIYGTPQSAPEGHAEDIGFITRFQRL